MDPREIAKLMDEDPDIFVESGTPGAIEFPENDEARASKKRKRRIKRIKRRNKQRQQYQKDKEDYKVDKITGQPKAGKILYSDVPTDNPQKITEDLDAEGRIVYAMRELGRQMNTAWTSGSDQGIEKWRRNSSLLRGVKSKVSDIKRLLGTRFGPENCQFLEDMKVFERVMDEAELASSGKNEVSYISFPPPNWWGRKSWASNSEKRYYIEVFMGEVLTRYFGMVELYRYRHAKYCDDEACISEGHGPFVLNKLICGPKGTDAKIRLTRVFDDFNERRNHAFKIRNKSKKDSERPREFAPDDPDFEKLLMLEKYLRKVLGKAFSKSPLPRMLSAFHRPEDMKQYTEQYVAAASSYFGAELVNKLWQKVNK